MYPKQRMSFFESQKFEISFARRFLLSIYCLNFSELIFHVTSKGYPSFIRLYGDSAKIRQFLRFFNNDRQTNSIHFLENLTTFLVKLLLISPQILNSSGFMANELLIHIVLFQKRPRKVWLQMGRFDFCLCDRVHIW
jgi:hypothetical protein